MIAMVKNTIALPQTSREKNNLPLFFYPLLALKTFGFICSIPVQKNLKHSIFESSSDGGDIGVALFQLVLHTLSENLMW